MILDKFKTFESISNSLDKGIPINESLDEGVISSVTNFLSKMFGGAVSKIDKILDKYKTAEVDYWKDWADARGKSAEAEVLAKVAKTDVIQQAKYKEQQARIDKLLKQVEDKRADVKDALERQAKSIIKNSDRLNDYWNMKKAVLDEQAARESYSVVKKSTDNETIHDLFDNEIQKAAKKAKEKEAEFKAEYGGKKFKDSEDDDDDDYSVSGIKMKDLMTRSLSDMKPQLKTLDGDEIKTLLDAFNREIKDKTEYFKNTISDKDELFKEKSELSKRTQPILDFIKTLVGTTKDVKKEVKQEPDVVTDVTAKEIGAENVNKAVDDAVATASAEVKNPGVKDVVGVITDQVKKNFQSAKGSIEEAVGGPIEDSHYTHLKNDMIALYGKLSFYYEKLGSKLTSKTLEFGLIDFASEILKYKKKKGLLTKDLPKADLEKLFDTYSK